MNDCWSCVHQDLRPSYTFLGECRYFRTIGKEAKEIPPTIVDRGCKFYGQKKERPDHGEGDYND